MFLLVFFPSLVHRAGHWFTELIGLRTCRFTSQPLSMHLSMRHP